MSLICTVSFNQEYFLLFVLSITENQRGVKYFLLSAKILLHVIDTNGEKVDLTAGFILHIPLSKNEYQLVH